MKTIVVLPAYNCAKTLEQTIIDIPTDIVNDIVFVDDCSIDNSCEIAEKLSIPHIHKHIKNLGYGANQKKCYDIALSLNADVIIMLHPDYQYDPKLIGEMLKKITAGDKIVFGSRFLHGAKAIKNGMPLYKFYANRILTIFQNRLLRKSLSEYHTGYRAYTKEVLTAIPYHEFSNDFIFDNQFILKAFDMGFDISEIYCPAKYEKQSSSINFIKSLKYGILVIYYTLLYKFK